MRDRALVAEYGAVERLLPVEWLVVRVDHCEVPVEGVEGVAYKGACLGADYGAPYRV